VEIRWEVFLMIAGASIVTFIPRIVPLVLLSRIRIPDWGMTWLKYVPIAVMAALVGQELFLENGKPALFPPGPELYAALPTIAVALLTRSLLATVVAGMISMMLLRALLG